MRADLAQFFQVNIDDVWAGRVPARHVVRLIEHLALMPQSRVAAIESGDIEWMGWDVNTTILATTHNLLAHVIAGLGKNVNVEKLLIRTPGSGEEEEPQALEFPTIADFLSHGAVEQFMKG